MYYTLREYTSLQYVRNLRYIVSLLYVINSLSAKHYILEPLVDRKQRHKLRMLYSLHSISPEDGKFTNHVFVIQSGLHPLNIHVFLK